MFSDDLVAARNEPWRPRPGAGRARPLRFFRRAALEPLGRTHPALPFALLGPVAGWLVDRSAALADAPGAPSLPARLGLFLAGVLGWTLVEYVMHRFWFHLTPRADWARVAMLFVHGHHHLVPDDPHRLVATPWQIGSLLLLVGGIVGAALPWLVFLPVAAGFVVGYLAYEALHYRAHHARPRTRLGRALQRHHLLHHAGVAEGRWGISTPLWDWVFRTLPARRVG